MNTTWSGAPPEGASNPSARESLASWSRALGLLTVLVRPTRPCPKMAPSVPVERQQPGATRPGWGGTRISAPPQRQDARESAGAELATTQHGGEAGATASPSSPPPTAAVGVAAPTQP